MAARDSTQQDEASKTIDLDRMSLDELDQLRQREQGRLQALTPRLAQLTQAQARIGASQQAVTAHDQTENGAQVMIPLTESVYVPARQVAHSPGLLVDLGTGFYCNKTCPETLEYLNRKLQIVEANRENVSRAVLATRHNLDAIQVSMQGKLLEIRAKQEGARHRKAVEG
jgi:prefoldin alpha subunit